MEHIENIDSRLVLSETLMLISRIEQFLRKTEMSATRLGRLAISDPRFVADLRRGRLPRPSTERRLDRFMTTYRETQANAD